jgi:hypothetical protein
MLAIICPTDWLSALAADLAGRWGDDESRPAIVVRDASRGTSRHWRRAQPAPGQRPHSTCFLLTWGLIFFGVGTFFLVLISQALVRNDPGDNLQGAYPWKWLWILFPFPFIIPGALVVLYAFRRRNTIGLSPEQAKAVEAEAPPPVDRAGVVAPADTVAKTEYPAVPSVEPKPGIDLAARVPGEFGGGCAVLAALVVLLICSGVLSPLLVHVVGAIRAWQMGEYTGMAAFFILFFGLMWVMVAVWLVKEWRLWRLGAPAVEASALPLYCGEACELLVTVPGPARFRRLRVAVVCEEEASYTEGTTTRKETKRVYEQQLASEEDLDVGRREPFRVRGSFHPPPAAMHSFKGTHNEVRWLVRVEGEAERLFPLKFAHDFRLEVRPLRTYGGKS